MWLSCDANGSPPGGAGVGCVVRLDPTRSKIQPLDDDLADLDHWHDVGVVGDVAQNLGAVRLDGGLVAFD